MAGLAREGDVLLGISTSGNSGSILAACDAGQTAGCHVLGLTGRDGGSLIEHCDAVVIAPAQDTAYIQECHIIVIHLLCALIERGLDLA